MPITWTRITARGSTHEVPEFWCEDCGTRASFGIGVSLRQAKGKDDPRLGRWYCGYIKGEPVCSALASTALYRIPAQITP